MLIQWALLDAAQKTQMLTMFQTLQSYLDYSEMAHRASTMLVTASQVDAIREREYCTKFVGFLLYCLFVRPNTPIFITEDRLHSMFCRIIDVEPSSGTPSSLDEERRDKKNQY